MKVKEANLTANIVWSPSSVTPTYLACGTSAQQLDASFNSSSVIQLYDLNLADTSLDMRLAGSLAVPNKFHQLLWQGNNEGKLNQPLGLLVGGCDNGSISIYSPSKLLKKEKALLMSLEGKHTGPVRALDFNFQQSNLLASGSSNCEIFIWDINDNSAPMTPGQKPDLSSEVTSIGWNRQVEHIMAATYGGRCVVYDLRKGASIIQISESISQIKSHNISWDPSIATRLIVSSNDDVTPIAQVWDLRYAASPISTLEGHQRGIARTQWCPEDPDLFITCGKDNRILVWNPNTSIKGGEIVGEFPAYNQWSFDLAWCRKDPSLVATATIDSYVSVYSLLGAGSPPNQTSKFSAIADSFPGMEMPSDMPLAPSNAPIQLKKPPKWFARRSGACFGFGGRLLSWDSESRQIKLSQVVTEPEFLSKSDQLDNVLSQADLKGHCFSKSQQAITENDRTLWSFLGASFDACSRTQFTQLLGFQADEVAKKVRPHTLGVDVQQLADKIADLPVSSTTSTSSLDPAEQFELISANSANKTPEVIEVPDLASGQGKLSLKIGDDPEGQLRHALLLGDFQSAVEVCLRESNYSLALIFAAEAGSDLFEKTKERVLQHQCQNRTLVKLILKKQLGDLVATCQLEDWKAALVAVLNYADPQELVVLSESLGERLQASGKKDYLRAALLCFICAGNLDQFAACLSRANPQASTSPKVLQEVVEVLVILQKALASSGRSITTDQQGATNNILNSYATLLASQGALSRAMSYLGNGLQGEVALLKERVTKALGYSNANRMRMTSTSSTQSSIRRTSTPMVYQNQPPMQKMNPVMPPGSQPQFFNPSVQTPTQHSPMPHPVSSYPSFQQSVPAPPQFGGFQPSTPAMVPSVPPTGPPPTDIGNANFGARKTGGNRYVSATPPAPSNMWTPRPVAAPNSSFASPPMVSQAAPYSSPNFPGGMQSHEAFSPPVQESGPGLPPPAAFDPNVPRGWNDPPQISASRKAKQQKPPPVPSTSMATMQPGDPNPVNQFMSSMPQNVPSMGYSSFSGQQSQRHSAAPPPPPPVEKGPIPTEHQELKDVFDHLRAKGIATTSNPTAKQRLEDLGPKLELLYDKLREGKISPTTTDGLHRIVSLIKAGDYHQALMTHSTTISSGNFSEMASFMPAIKMLLSMCMQCQVFL